jgi:hypothetical protein
MRRWAVQAGALAILAVVVVFLVVPQMRTAVGYLGVLGRPRTGWVVLGISLEAASFVAYGLFTRSLLPEDGRPSWHWLLRLDVVGAGLTHILPGGGATASGLRFKMLKDNGVTGTDAALASVVQGLGSAIVRSARAGWRPPLCHRGDHCRGHGRDRHLGLCGVDQG